MYVALCYYKLDYYDVSVDVLQVYLTECIYQLVLESQLPHKTVNLIFSSVIVNNKLTILWGS